MRTLCVRMLACGGLLGLMVLVAGPAEGGAKGKKPNAANTKSNGANEQVIKLLKEARQVAHEAPEEYHDHRKHAIKHLENAAKELEKAGSASSGGAGKGKKKGGDKAKGNKADKKSAKVTHHAEKHIDDAIKQIKEGLKFHATKYGTEGQHFHHALKLTTSAKQMLAKK